MRKALTLLKNDDGINAVLPLSAALGKTFFYDGVTVRDNEAISILNSFGVDINDVLTTANADDADVQIIRITAHNEGDQKTKLFDAIARKKEGSQLIVVIHAVEPFVFGSIYADEFDENFEFIDNPLNYIDALVIDYGIDDEQLIACLFGKDGSANADSYTMSSTLPYTINMNDLDGEDNIMFGYRRGLQNWKQGMAENTNRIE